MTRKEAINRIIEIDIRNALQEDYDALNIAIEALEQEPKTDVLDKIRAEIIEEKDFAYADFEQYKVDYLGADAEYVEDELPQDDFRYGMERAIEIIDKHISGKENE